MQVMFFWSSPFDSIFLFFLITPYPYMSLQQAGPKPCSTKYLSLKFQCSAILQLLSSREGKNKKQNPPRAVFYSRQKLWGGRRSERLHLERVKFCGRRSSWDDEKGQLPSCGHFARAWKGVGFRKVWVLFGNNTVYFQKGNLNLFMFLNHI